MEFDEIAEFRKDLKKLLKRYRSLHDDLSVIRDRARIVKYFK